MPFYRFKGFVADVMLYLAGILNGGLLIDPELFEQLGEKRMALVHFSAISLPLSVRVM